MPVGSFFIVNENRINRHTVRHTVLALRQITPFFFIILFVVIFKEFFRNPTDISYRFNPFSEIFHRFMDIWDRIGMNNRQGKDENQKTWNKDDAFHHKPYLEFKIYGVKLLSDMLPPMDARIAYIFQVFQVSL